MKLKLFSAKKGINLLTWWVELLTFAVLVAGFVFSVLSIKSAVVSYVIVVLFGFMGGRFIYYRKYGFPFYMITMGFLIGYVLGTRYGDWKLVALFFLLGASVSYYAHTKDWLKNV